MASTSDLEGLVFIGPYKRDSALGFQDANAWTDNDATTSNVIQAIHKSTGLPNTRNFARGEALYAKSGSNYVISGQSSELLFPASVPVVSTGIIDITYTTALSSANYGIHVTGFYSSVVVLVTPSLDPTYKTTTGIRLYGWTGSLSSPTQAYPDGFEITLYYDND